VETILAVVTAIGRARRRPEAVAAMREADLHGEKRTNDTHALTTDLDARLYRKGKGKETKLCFMVHGLMENRHGLLVAACMTEASGYTEPVAALHMIESRAERPHAITLGADKDYDTPALSVAGGSSRPICGIIAIST
jgi:hypothetical protein